MLVDPMHNLAPAAGVTGLAAVVLAETTGVADPWWIAAIVVPLAGFAAWLVRWILQRQERREADLQKIAEAREAREDKRAEQLELQTRALQQCVVEMRALRDGQMQHAQALEALSGRVAAAIQPRDP